MVTPFGVTPAWLSARNGALAKGFGEREARLEADRLCGIRGKDFARCPLPGGVTLTIPVAGGSHSLRNPAASPLLSDHGKWRREHAGAWAAAYGRTPWFMHLMPETEALYRRSEAALTGLEDFNSAFLELLSGWLDFDGASRIAPGRQAALRRDAALRCPAPHTLAEAVFILGPDAVFAVPPVTPG